ncbi:MAG: hypothetical protein AAGB35_02160 [Pseudomonadota bacterium]
MKILKYFAGSLIMSFGLIVVCLLLVRAIGIGLPGDFASYLLIIWLLLAIFMFPLAKKIVRV